MIVISLRVTDDVLLRLHVDSLCFMPNLLSCFYGSLWLYES